MKTSLNHADVQVDDQIFECLDIDNPKSFFLFAGAGSGKTRSLVNVLEKMRRQHAEYYRQSKRKIAIITYTNAASEEIIHRLEQDDIFYVSTIHSFVWDLIKNYPRDIKSWLKKHIADEIADLQNKQLTGRAGTKAMTDRASKIESYTNRLAKLSDIHRFTYNPNGDNKTRDSLNHTEVIAIAADFILHKQLMQELLVARFPILLVDESQDTKKDLIDAFFHVQQSFSDKFSLGLFGDTMQRIYSDGKENLGQNLPKDWVLPVKSVNYRCPKRVVKLINQIRSVADKQVQVSVEQKEEGFVRFFIVVNKPNQDKEAIELGIKSRMAVITEDASWQGVAADVKTLTLEHHMAARRMGFLGLFEPLYKADPLKTSLLDGSLSSLRFFSQIILPLVQAEQRGDSFEVARLVRTYAPAFNDDHFKKQQDQMIIIQDADSAVKSLMKLWDTVKEPTLYQILKQVHDSRLFQIPEPLNIIARRQDKMQEAPVEVPDDDVINAWDVALQCTLLEVDAYNSYIENRAPYGTHQGVKGLQFPRVFVILDDEEARGFMFSYDKILGVKSPSDADLKNMKENKETSIDRTLRLFYVACSRAEKSLAIVAYTSDPKTVRQHVIKNGWFDDAEIEVV